MDLSAERYVESKYGLAHDDVNIEGLVTGEDRRRSSLAHHMTHQDIHNADQRDNLDAIVDYAQGRGHSTTSDEKTPDQKIIAVAEDISFRTQIAAFLILEFGVIFHSVRPRLPLYHHIVC